MILKMAWRNVWRNKMRSVVIVFSIASGLFAGIAVLALYEGMMKSRVKTVIEEEVGHLQLHHPDFKSDYHPSFFIANEQTVKQYLTQLPEIKEITQRTITQGMLSTPTGSTGIQINGIVPETEYHFSSLKQKIKDGAGFHPNRKHEILIGKKLASKMKLKTGSKLVLTFSDTGNTIVSGAFRVTAIYESSNSALDERIVYVQQQELNELIGNNRAIHEIAVILKSDKQLNRVSQQIRQQFPDLLTETWTDISPETYLMVKTVDDYSYIILTIIMLALAFGIVNTMLMAIMERFHEIGMMIALGTSRIRIFFLILTETILLTLTGTPVGIATGWLITAYYKREGLNLSGMGREMMSSFGFRTLIYPEFPADKLFNILLIVFVTAVLSGLLPAIKAVKMKPVESLKI